MSKKALSRRSLLKQGCLALGVSMLPNQVFGQPASAKSALKPLQKTVDPQKVTYCLNSGTLMGYKLPIEKQIDLAAKAGYQAIEPWIRDIEAYRSQGNSLADLKKKIADLGLTVESAIGFATWIVDDDAKRKSGMDQAKRDMELVASIGGTRIAAPPTGATSTAGLDLDKAAARYRELLEIGDTMNVIPQVELWGFSKNLHKLGQAMYVVIESGHPKACLLPDVYHIYKGGSSYEGLKQLTRQSVQVFHMNDFPATPPREQINDKDRVYPGDGIAPMDMILTSLIDKGTLPILSLELFNGEYWKKPALEVAKTGLAKMKAAVASAIA